MTDPLHLDVPPPGPQHERRLVDRLRSQLAVAKLLLAADDHRFLDDAVRDLEATVEELDRHLGQQAPVGASSPSLAAREVVGRALPPSLVAFLR